MRLVNTVPLAGGAECKGNSSETKECEDRSCPQPCEWKDWEDWSMCSTSCGGGLHRRLRTQSPAKYGGALCSGSGTTQDSNCSTDPCPVDCKWNPWSDWTCSGSCLPASARRSRTINITASDGGAQCIGPESQSGPCADNLTQCPVDCTWSEWEDWSQCSSSCGQGFMRRLRNRTAYEKNGGSVCYGTQDDERVCTTGECPADCVAGDWDQWSTCPLSCGQSDQFRSRKVKTPAQNGGAECVCALMENRSCGTSACPTHCIWSDWADWSPCPLSCSGGVRSRARHEKVHAASGGIICAGGTKQDEVCNEQQCPIACSWGPWSEWGSCPVSCGGGDRSRARRKASLARFGGQECTGNDTASERCSDEACPVNCAWSDWTPWTNCSQACNSGLTTRNRSKISFAENGGVPCSGDDEEAVSCNTQACSQDCTWGPWTKWTPCSKVCGGGKTKRFRDVLTVKKHGGAECEGDTEEEADCNAAACPIDCVYGEWSQWSQCDKSCAGGFRSRKREKKVEDVNGGKPCEGDPLEKLSCDLANCPVDCVFSTWSDWGECTSSCGKGIRYKTRKREEGRYGGLACVGGLISSEDCVSNATGCISTTTTSTTSTTELPVSNLTDVIDAWLAGKPTSWDTPCAETTTTTPCAEIPAPCPGTIETTTKPKPNPLVTALTVEADKIKAGVPLKDALQAGIAAGRQAAGEGGAEPCETEELAKQISRYEDAKVEKHFENLHPQLQSWTHQGKTVSATVSGNLVLYAPDPQLVYQSGTARLSLERTLATLAEVDIGAVAITLKVPSEKEMAEVNQKTQGNAVVEYTIYIYKGESNSAESVSKALAKNNADAVTSVLQAQLPGFETNAISMSLRVTRNEK